MTKEELIELSDLNREDNIKYISSEAQGIAITLDSDRYAPTFCKLERAYICGRRKSEEQIVTLEKKNAELLCQKNRNKSCYSCANATERCFRNEIGCPCEKYKSWKDENAELKGLKDVATLIRANNDTVVTLMQLNNKLVSKSQQLAKAKEIIKQLLLLPYANNEEVNTDFTSILAEAEQFLNSEVEK